MGNSMQSINRIFTFLNINAQGKDKLIRAMKEPPVRTSARIAGSTLPPNALAIASYANDEQYAVIREKHVLVICHSWY